ncbi:MAG: hypothetical protein AAGA86_13880 [Bacteroidota bacterium]
MKTLLTFAFILFVGTAAHAMQTTAGVEVNTPEVEMVVLKIEKDVTPEKKEEVARLYKRSNTKVKKALSFTTKRNRAKLA